MNIRHFLGSVRYASRGIRYVFRHEQNFRLQVYSAGFVFAGAVALRLRTPELLAILFLSILVLILELLNSALEKFVDLLRPRLSLQVEIVKNIMAAMVLLASAGAVAIGGIIFYPHLKATLCYWLC